MKNKEEKSSELSERLRIIMEHYALSVAQIAEKVGGSHVKFYNLLNGASKPDFKTTARILEVFPEVSAEWFMRGGGPMLRQPIEPTTDPQEVLEMAVELDGLKKQNELLQDLLIKMARTEAKKEFVGKSRGGTKNPKDAGARMLSRQDRRWTVRMAPGFGFRRSAGK